MIRVFGILLVLISGASVANSAPGIRRLANLYICNSKTHSYCQRSPAHGQGYGVIIFQEGKKKKSYPVLPWGQNMVQTSKVAQALKSFRLNESKKQSSKPFVFTEQFMASGFVGIDPISKRHSVFYLTSMD